jgi:hypothetical protein
MLVVPAWPSRVCLSGGLVTKPAFGVGARPPKTAQKPGPHPLGQSVGEPVRPLDSGLEVPRQVTFAAGRLWTSTDTAIGPRGGPQRTGVLWLVITPSFDGRAVGGRISRQVTARGVRPYDAQTCYRAFEGDVAFIRGCWWGNYSAARPDAQGHIWMATEYIPQLPQADLANRGTSAGWPALTRQRLPRPAASRMKMASRLVRCAATSPAHRQHSGGWQGGIRRPRPGHKQGRPRKEKI